MMSACEAMMSFLFASAVICGGYNFGVSRSMHRLSQKISIQSALELHSIERNNEITYTSSSDERLLKVYESTDLISLPFKNLS